MSSIQTGWPAILVAGATGLVLGLLGSRLIRRPGPHQLFLSPFGRPGGRATAWELHPDPAWIPPQHQAPPHPLEPVLSFDPATMDLAGLYPLVISAVVPRPVAFVSTLSQDGKGNLAPYSYFNAVSHNPPVLAMGHCWSKGSPKDSLRNILQTKEMVVCIISEWFVESANHTSGPYPPDVNEMELAGLTPVASEKVRPPRVAESAVNMECRLLHHYDLTDRASGAVTCTVVLAEVLLFHIAEAVTTQTARTGKVVVDSEKLLPVCRFGGVTYGVRPALFDIARPDGNGKYPDESVSRASNRK